MNISLSAQKNPRPFLWQPGRANPEEVDQIRHHVQAVKAFGAE